MEKVSLNISVMYGDHHVLAVKSLLGALPGVESVFASSAFKHVVVAFDPGKISQADLVKVLTDNGYAPGVEMPVPVWKPVQQEGPRFVRASGLAQMTMFNVPAMPTGEGGPRPCPGFEFREFAPGGGHPGDQ